MATNTNAATKGNATNAATKGNASATNAAPELGKYAKAVKAAGGNPHAVPATYRHYNYTFTVGKNAPNNPNTVMGIIYNYIKANPGLTGNQLAQALVGMGNTFANTGAKVKYAKGGQVCAHWVIGYLNGGQRAKHAHWVATPPKG